MVEPISLVDVLPTTLDAVGVTPTTGEGDFPFRGKANGHGLKERQSTNRDPSWRLTVEINAELTDTENKVTCT